MESANLHIRSNTLVSRVLSFNWLLTGLILVFAGLGFAALYSAAGGNVEPWAKSQLIKFFPGLIIMFVIALITVRFWYFSAYALWWLGLGLLIFVEVSGHIGMGAQRWINLGFMKLQPSEFMKIAVIAALARYYQVLPEKKINTFKGLIIPVLILLVPMGLILKQPDLGTGVMLMAAGLCVIFLAGLSWKIVGAGVAGILAAGPLMWFFYLKDYQKNRVMTFLDPESDPLGTGYHITQSKIAIGSGGMTGKGYLEGSQSRLNFLPEKQTDFIFTLWAEEWGFIGGSFILLLVLATIYVGYHIANQSKHIFGRLLAYGLIINFSLYAFVNIGMVMGLLPVVGAPLPLISFGGSAMLAALVSFGLILSVDTYRGAILPRPQSN